MGPRLFCGLASCAGFLLVAPVQAQDASPDKARDAKGQSRDSARVSKPKNNLSFSEGVAAIIADRPAGSGPAWSDIDPERLANHFRLPDARQDVGTSKGPMAWSVVQRSIVDPSAPHRGVNLLIDGGAPGTAPTDQWTERSGRLAEYEMSAAAACAGLMPSVACASNFDGDDSMVRLALAYNF